MRILTLVLSLVLLFAVAGAAAGAPRVGSVDDPVDVRFPGQEPDAQRVVVSYEPGDGSLTATLHLHAPLGTTASPGASVAANLLFGIGGAGEDGACAVPGVDAGEGRAGDLRFAGTIDSNGPPDAVTDVFGGTVQTVGGSAIATPAGEISGDRRVITWTVAAGPERTDRDYRCVADVEMRSNAPEPDLVAPFFFAGHEPPPPPPAPAATTPGAATTVAPPVPILARGDLTAPRLRLSVGSRSLRALRANGLMAPVSCDERCALTVRLLVRPLVARALGISRLIGTSRAIVVPGRRAAVRLHLTRAARRALAGRARTRVALALTVSDGAGNRRTLTRGLLLTP